MAFVRDHLDHPDLAGGTTVHPPALPSEVDEALVAQGVNGQRGRFMFSTIDARLGYLLRIHKDADLDVPTKEGRVQRFYLAARRLAAAAPGGASQSSTRIQQVDMEKMLQTCDGSPTGVRDRALLLFGWVNGGRRRSEIQAADFQYLIDRGHRVFEYNSPEQDGDAESTADRPALMMRGALGEAMSAWLLMIEERGGDTHVRRVDRPWRVRLAPCGTCNISTRMPMDS